MTTAPEFNTTVEANHTRIDSTAYADIYVVGDVHGSRAALESLLATLDPSEGDLVVPTYLGVPGDFERRDVDDVDVGEQEVEVRLDQVL